MILGIFYLKLASSPEMWGLKPTCPRIAVRKSCSQTCNSSYHNFLIIALFIMYLTDLCLYFHILLLFFFLTFFLNFDILL